MEKGEEHLSKLSAHQSKREINNYIFFKLNYFYSGLLGKEKSKWKAVKESNGWEMISGIIFDLH